MSKLKKVNILSYAAVAILAFVCIYFVYQTITLKREVSNLIDANINLVNNGEEEAMSRADSLLIAGKYEDALDNYQQLSQNNGLNTELRKTITTRLLSLKNQIAKTNKRDSIPESDTSATNSQEAGSSIKDIDSLSFALEKAQMQLKSVREQMSQNTFGKYITFKSTKGNRLHYVGGVKNKKANGFGIAILDSGSRYEGEWQDNKRHGQGTFYWIDGEHYQGTYKNDLRSGQGTYYWTNGEKFVGSWSADKRNGEGTFYGKDGEIVTSGIWEDDQLVKEDK